MDAGLVSFIRISALSLTIYGHGNQIWSNARPEFQPDRSSGRSAHKVHSERLLNIPDLSTAALLASGIIAVLTGGMVPLAVRARRRRRPLEEIRNGCRTEYGPLELFIEATDRVNGFQVFVEAPRMKQPRVSEEAVHCTLDSAKDRLVLKAGEYLAGLTDSAQYSADWRCS